MQQGELQLHLFRAQVRTRVDSTPLAPAARLPGLALLLYAVMVGMYLVCRARWRPGWAMDKKPCGSSLVVYMHSHRARALVMTRARIENLDAPLP